MYCREPSAVKYGDGWALAVSLPCRSWLCLDCQPRRRAQLIELAAGGAPNRLITITVNPEVGDGPLDRARLLARAWRIVVARARRSVHKEPINYLAVFEATKRGEPHLHILARCGFISQRWLSDQMGNVLQSPIVDIRRIHNVRHAARYVAKYIGKAPHKFGTCKRYWHTKLWVAKDLDGPVKDNVWGSGWVYTKKSVWQLCQFWISAGLDGWLEKGGTAGYGTPPARPPPPSGTAAGGGTV